jgi:hypothetical protein
MTLLKLDWLRVRLIVVWFAPFMRMIIKLARNSRVLKFNFEAGK